MNIFLCFRPDRYPFDRGTHGSNCIRGTHGMASDTLSNSDNWQTLITRSAGDLLEGTVKPAAAVRQMLRQSEKLSMPTLARRVRYAKSGSLLASGATLMPRL